MIELRDATASDYAIILELNESAIPHVNRIDRETLASLHAEAFYFRLAESRGAAVGFLIALREDAQYESLNFQWFKNRYPSFVYIDRVAVASTSRRLGIGRKFYQELEGLARPVSSLLACEVNLKPANPGSMRFHEKLGFVEVGQQDTEAGTKRVSLMVKQLRSPVDSL